MNEGICFGISSPAGSSIVMTPTDEPVLNSVQSAVLVWSPMKHPTFVDPVSTDSPFIGTETGE